MQSVLDVLQEQNLEKEAEALQNFYDSVRRRAAGIDSAEAKQRIIVELYDKFFRKAFPRMTEKLGIVYTPVEIVDFIIRSVDEVLRSEFDQNLGSEGVHVIDPFTGTGTFITRLLQSGLIAPQELRRKYQREIHANEIVLLAYYIAAINIEAVFNAQDTGDYVPFDGICLTDTFQLYEQERDLVSDLMADNSHRRSRQKDLDLRVIVGNPPYSAGQDSANDNAANVRYPRLDQRIRDTYAARTDATNKNALYDSYIRAIRWASDRIGEAGVVAYVTNAGWIDTAVANGIRKSVVEEFSTIHVFNLRGNQRTSGERSRREGGKIFGSGSRTPVAIAIFVKNPASSVKGRVLYHDIGDYLTREEKLARIANFGSISGIHAIGGFNTLVPDEHGDWLGQRDSSFDRFMPMGDKGKMGTPTLFENYSSGLKTQRDAWCFNYSRKGLEQNMRAMVYTYDAEADRLDAVYGVAERKAREGVVDATVSHDPSRISWTRALKADLVKGKRFRFEQGELVQSLYRPFTRQWLYYSRHFNEMVYQMPRLFPGASAVNRAIMVEGSWRGSGNIAVMVDSIACQLSDGGCQLFPRYIFDKPVEDSPTQQQSVLFPHKPKSGSRRDALTDEGLSHFRAAYNNNEITKDDAFYYTYGILHSQEYLDAYCDTLSKQLPRIPLVRQMGDFWAFAEAGRKLADLHCDYEKAQPYPVTIREGDLTLAVIDDAEAFYRVEKMKFGGKRPKLDKTTVIYNPRITMTNVPLEAYDYVVNGKPALEWVMERQVVKTDKDSGIVNDANRYAIETVGDPAYPLKLFQRVITVSLETMKIVRSLPPLDIMPAAEPAASTTH
jgi:predicted helicase